MDKEHQSQGKLGSEPPVQQQHKQTEPQPNQQLKQTEQKETEQSKPEIQQSDPSKEQKIKIDQKETEKVHELKSDTEGTITKAELTLLHNRDPIHPEKTKDTEQNKQLTALQQKIEKSESKNEVKIEEVIVEGEIKITKQQVKLEDIGSFANERPISINIGKDAFQLEKPVVKFQEPDVKIEINQSVQKGFALNKQTHFRIVGFDRHGPIDIFRKMSEFESLRKILLQRWPGCFVPALSQKSDARNDQLRNLHRRKNLQNFLRKLSYSEQIYYKEEIQLFLRSVGIDIEEMFLQMPVLRVRDVIERFKTCYGQTIEIPNSPQFASSITRFSTSLKKIANSLSNLSKRVLKLAESYQVYQQSLPKFASFLNHYQQACLSQYANNIDFSIALRDKQNRLGKLKSISQKKNIFYEFYFLLDNQNRDAESLSDVILAMEMFNIKRDELQDQSKQTRLQIDEISLGHKNLKVMTGRKTKQQVQHELEQKQKQLIAEKHLILELQSTSQIVLANVTIPLFKRMKVNNYFNIIKKWSELVGDANIDAFEVWKFLQQESKQQIKKISSV